MALPIVSQAVAYNGSAYHVLDYPVRRGRVYIELSQCPGTIENPDAGWHENWEPPEPIFVALDEFIRIIQRSTLPSLN
jgi:hypothetical protein